MTVRKWLSKRPQVYEMSKTNSYPTIAISGLGCFLNVTPNKGLQNISKCANQISGFVCVSIYVEFQSQSTSESSGGMKPQLDLSLKARRTSPFHPFTSHSFSLHQHTTLKINLQMAMLYAALIKYFDTGFFLKISENNCDVFLKLKHRATASPLPQPYLPYYCDF